MFISDLNFSDSQLVRVSGVNPHAQAQTITLPENAASGSVLFARNQKFFNKIKEKLNPSCKLSELFFILDLNLQKELLEKNDAFYAKLHQEAGGLFTSPQLEVSLTQISRCFYNVLNRDLNDFVDGRQMGTASIHPTALIAQNVFIGEDVKIAANVVIHPGCVILSKSSIGEGTILYPNVSVYRFVAIGKNCRIHAGCIIGADGFGYHFHQGHHLKIWHLAGVNIENDVEIGANSCVDRGAFKATLIGEGSKIDNQVQVGHNCQIGKKVILCGQVGVAGSTTLEDYVVVGGGAGIGPDLVISKGSQIAGMAGVNGYLPPQSKVAGHPARPVHEWLKGLALVRKLTSDKKNRE